MTRRDFVAMIAGFLKDGETDEEGREFTMEGDDAIHDMNSLIDMAREINCRGDLTDGG